MGYRQLAIQIILVLVLGRSAPAADFAREVRPIFAAACYSCHGADKQKGGLRLDVKSAAMKGGVSGAAIVAGRAKESLLVQRLHSQDPDERMPQKAEPLSSQQIAVITTWIDQGAPWPEEGAAETAGVTHWAFVKPRRLQRPAVRHAAWVRNAIDAFVLARLEKEGLTPSPPAAKETLLRRVSLDLTGLPPTIEEIDAFLADSNPDAYERVVERLLASPAYGERWARHWLDAARYADSNGYSLDRPRSIWPYRDWVIQALNADMPFDQFTIEQLAGDLLPGATLEQKIATGFHRNTQINEEGGIDPEQFRVEAVIDRVGTTGTVWLGLTIACAQCHNHKFDPLSQKEYYQLFAFFNNCDEPKLTVTTRQAAGSKRPAPVTTLVLAERKTPRATHVLIKGDFTRPAEKVTPGTPSVLHPFKGERGSRLELARWLVDPDNPLTARVTVNRIWQQHFGRGLVETENDFGTQGTPPSHPELLDWLATELIRQKWSMKAMHRLIVTSATYRQASVVRPEIVSRDPYNRLLARQSRNRLEAEIVRDVALRASGLLTEKLGGPSVYPPQPEGVASLGQSKQKWPTSTGPERYRRGMYTFQFRATLHPVLSAFDAPEGTSACTRRVKSNTPLQALTLLNDEAFAEFAQGLAHRIIRQASGDVARVELGFRLCTGRTPDSVERGILLQLLARQRASLRTSPAARKLAHPRVPESALAPEADEVEIAAWTVVARTLLNLDETITRE
jgi:mono/diheme cytochrome c family protein